MSEVQQAAHHVPGLVTGLFAALLVVMIGSLALEERLHAKKSVIVGVFAVLCLLLGGLLGLLPFGDMVLTVGEQEIALPVYIPAIDWGVVTIILGSSLFVDGCPGFHRAGKGSGRNRLPERERECPRNPPTRPGRFSQVLAPSAKRQFVVTAFIRSVPGRLSTGPR